MGNPQYFSKFAGLLFAKGMEHTSAAFVTI